MYVAGWLSLVIISLWVSLAAFVWAYRSGQFSDQERARYLPLEENLPAPPACDRAKPPVQMYSLLAILALGLIVLSAALFISILRLRG